MYDITLEGGTNFIESGGTICVVDELDGYTQCFSTSVNTIDNGYYLDGTIVITAPDGYVFKTIPIESSYYSPTENTDSGWVDRMFTGDEKVQEYVLSSSDFFQNKARFIFIDNQLELIARESESVETLPFTKAYEVSIPNLNELSNYSYVEREIKSGFSYDFEMLDYAKYITSLYVFPYKIEPLDNEVDILLGDLNTEIKANQILEPKHKLELGTILINSNIVDNIGFKNIEIKAFVPNFNSITLEVDEVLGFKIDFNLTINIITGVGTLNIYSQRTKSIIYSESKQLGVKIPYYLGDKLDTGLGSDVLETEYTEPYIQLKVLKPNNDVRILGSRLIDVDNEFKFMKDDDNINIQSYATDREQKLIKEAIARGVYIRK